MFYRLQKLLITAILPVSVCMFICVLPAAWARPCREPEEGTWHCPATVPVPAVPVGRRELSSASFLPGDVVAAEKEALQAGQAVHLSLERERDRGRGKRERWRDVKRRRWPGRGHCIVTVVRALYPFPFPQSPCSSRLLHTASPSTLRMHIHIQHAACTWRGGAGERV